MLKGMKKIYVLGAGVNGVCCAFMIKQWNRVYDVILAAETFSPSTTSDASGGFWEPHLLEGDKSRITRWGNETFQYMVDLANSPDAYEAGTSLCSGHSIFFNKPQDPTHIQDTVLGFSHMAKQELLKQFPEYNFGWNWTTAITESRRYLPWMTERFLSMGGKLQKMTINNLSQIPGDCDILVNCTGMGSKYLFNDQAMKAIKGQLVHVSAPWVKHFINADDEYLYMIPGTSSVILGGTMEKGNYSLDVDPKERQRIITGCARILPSLAKATFIKDVVALRPFREGGIRLEKDFIYRPEKTIKVVHNYGHGGSGITLHWGCAKETLSLVKELLQE